MKLILLTIAAALPMVLGPLTAANAERIKDITEIQGVRSNPLMGVGLVVGLAGTGDRSLPSRQLMTNILRRAGVVFDTADLSNGSVALVMVTAELGPFDRRDSRIDVVVSTIEDAPALQGGMLLPTELRGLDGQVYAVASGPVSTSSVAVSGEKASVTTNHPTVAMIPGGATVERQELANFIEVVGGERLVTLTLRNQDFTTAQNISSAINAVFPRNAVALDAGSIRIRIPETISQRDVISFLDSITQLEVRVDMPAIVVINERTGTIVVGENVGISSVAISQGSLVVKVKESEFVSQPGAPFGGGSTERVQDTMLGIQEKSGHLIPIQKVVTVYDLAKALNAIGASPRDLIAIFNMLKKAGALQARLEIM